MARTRIIIGHPAQSGSQPPFLVYLGASGSEAEAAMKADDKAHHYEIFEGPGRRKNNAAYIWPAAFPTPVVKPPAAPSRKRLVKASKELREAATTARATASALRLKADEASRAVDENPQAENAEDLVTVALNAEDEAKAAEAAVLVAEKAADEAEAALK